MSQVDILKNKRIKNSYTLPIFLLSLASFVFALTEFVVSGIGLEIAQNYGVTLSQSELMITLYAVGVVVGGPITTLFTNKVSLNKLMLILFLNFAFGNIIVVSAMSSPAGFGLMLFGRVVSAVSNGLFFSVASTIVVGIVPQEKKSKSLSQLFNGITLAAAAGAPIGILIATSFSGGVFPGWKIIFTIIIIFAVIVGIILYYIIPRKIENQPVTTIKENLSVLKDKHIYYALIPTALVLISTFILYPNIQFIVTAPNSSVPVLGTNAAGVDYGVLNNNRFLFLIVGAYGVALTIGNNIGGRIVSKKIYPALYYAIAISSILPLLMMPSMFNSFGSLVPSSFNVIFILLIGVSGFLRTPGLQINILKYAEMKHSNKINFISALNISAFNIGITLGSLFGSIIFSNNFVNLKWILIPMALVGLFAFPFLFKMSKVFKLNAPFVYQKIEFDAF